MNQAILRAEYNNSQSGSVSEANKRIYSTSLSYDKISSGSGKSISRSRSKNSGWTCRVSIIKSKHSL